MAGRRNLILTAALAGLIALVAVASRGHSPAGNGPTHGIDSRLIWEFVLLAILAMFIICLPVALWVILTTRMETMATQQKRRQRTIKQVMIFLAIRACAW